MKQKDADLIEQFINEKCNDIHNFIIKVLTRKSIVYTELTEAINEFEKEAGNIISKWARRIVHTEKNS